MADSVLLGTWILKSFEWVRDLDESVLLPYGDAPRGFLHYSRNGHFFVHVESANRDHAGRSSDDLEPSVAKDLMSSHFSYAGTFTVDGATVSHHVETASMPDWVGTTQVRRWFVNDSNLHITAAGVTNGTQIGAAELIWERRT